MKMKKAEDKIPVGIYWSEGVADLTPFENQEKIPIGILVRGGGGFDPLCRQAEDKIPIGIYGSEGVAGLIPYEDSLKVRSKSI